MKTMQICIVACCLASVGNIAAAQTATDVQCAGCVGTSDIRANSVTSAKIQNGTITGGDVADNSLTSAKIRNGTIELVDLSPTLQEFVGASIASISVLGVSASAGSGVGAECPEDRIPVSASCSCNLGGQERNLGVIADCSIVGTGAIAQCFPEAITYDPNLPLPLASITTACLGAESLDGSPWLPSAAGLTQAAAPVDASESSDDRNGTWLKEQKAAFETAMHGMKARLRQMDGLLFRRQ